MPDRYVVREIEGDLTMRDSSPSKPWGLSVVVLDSRVNYRLVREFKSEKSERGPSGGNASNEQARAWARRQGAELAARLNEANP